MKPITAAELARGWVEFICPQHGLLVVTTPLAEVRCGCGQAAYAARNGRRLPRTSLHRIKRSKESLQIEG